MRTHIHLLLVAALAAVLWSPLRAQAQPATVDPEDEEGEDDAGEEDQAVRRRHSDFVDTRLTITFGDDDLLAATGEQVPISPEPGFGDRRGYELFYDNLNTRFSSRETLSHLVLYNKMPSFFEDITTEAALVMRLRLEDDGVALSDTGSYLRAAYNPWSDAPDDGLSVVAFPFDSERFRLGYLWTLSFGGADFVPRASLFRSPGMKVQLDRGLGYYFLGFKTIPARTALDVEIDSGAGGDVEVETVRVDETQYMFLGGAGWDLLDDSLRIDLGAGYFQQGVLDVPGYPRVQLYSVGGAARIAVHDQMDVGQSIDFRLYRNDPNAPLRYFSMPEYVPGRLGWLVSLEGDAVVQHLADADRANRTVLQPAYAGALQGRMQYGYLRLELTGLYRDVPYILKNVPGFVPFLTVPEAAEQTPEYFFALAGDFHFPGAFLTVGLSGGLQFPASLRTETDFGSGRSGRTLVIRQEGFFSILPPDTDVVPIVGARAHVRWDLSEMLYTLMWVQYVHDENATRLVVSSSEGTRRLFQRGDQLGFGLSAAARF